MLRQITVAVGLIQLTLIIMRASRVADTVVLYRGCPEMEAIDRSHRKLGSNRQFQASWWLVGKDLADCVVIGSVWGRLVVEGGSFFAGLLP